MPYTNFPDGVNATGLQITPNTTTTGVVVMEEVTLTETAGAGTYTGSVNVPAGAYLIDVIVQNDVLWTNAGTATLKVGDGTDDDGFYININLKATDLTVGQTITLDMPGGKQGAYVSVGTYPDSHVLGRYNAAARVISAIATTSSTGGGAGRTRMIVVYAAPGSTTAATKA